MTAALATAAPAHEVAGGTQQNGSAWIILDRESLRCDLARALRETGWNIVALLDGVQATRALLATRPPTPDLIVCGLRFHDGDAMQLIRPLAQQPKTPSLFFVSHQKQAVIRAAMGLAEALDIDVIGFAEKPADINAIRRLLAPFRLLIAAAPHSPPTVPLSSAELTSLLRTATVRALFQPKIRIVSGEISGFEALMRLEAADGSLINPDRFIPALALNGTLDEATFKMMAQAVEFVQRCRRELLSVTVAVNVSIESMSDAHFCRELEAIVRRAQIDPNWMTLEITETDAVADLAAVIENAARARMSGFNLAIDDFGTSYSSLFQLSHIPFSELKIERQFVHAADSNADHRAIVATCAQLGASFNLRVVAEGVETEAELKAVRQAGCTEAQGFLIAPPMAADETVAWMCGLPVPPGN